MRARHQRQSQKPESDYELLPERRLSNDPDIAASHWLEWPEECLWVRYPDHISMLTQDRLRALYCGDPPETPTEEIIAADRVWLRVYLDHVIGEYVIMLNADGPL